ncbi:MULTISPECIES: hypothetical protein [Phaeobacter]|uniref:hypothetical protein n=1 Tax=Phaeobacter TaxID=302485 RepID=UPI00058B646C|nr:MULTISPECIES: hypothetical protein [Phaeobacter]AUQ89401.1 hypothetical protein PhaeoP24_00755 [Phaeobacter inhibens]KII12584.1 hypothetical protein OO25_16985 [Phaeobacter sp. S60]
MSNEKTALADYEVMQDREIGGVFRSKGEVLPMTARQAKYYLPPYGSGLKLFAGKNASKSAAVAGKASA